LKRKGFRRHGGMEDCARAGNVVLLPDLVLSGAGDMCDVYVVLAWPSIQDRSNMIAVLSHSDPRRLRDFQLFILCSSETESERSQCRLSATQ